MSSSRIIKSDRAMAHLRDFRFRELHGEGPASVEEGNDVSFTPIMPGMEGACQTVVSMPADPGASEAAQSETPIITGISEDEADRREQAAFNAGLSEGRRQAEESLAHVSEALAKALLSTGGLRQRVMQESEEDLLKLAIVIARKIILQEISIDRRILVNIVKAAVNNVSEGDEIVVRLNPSDYEVVADHREFFPLTNDKRKMLLKADDTIPGGGCLVETSMGAIDARVEAQLDEIFRRFMEDRTLMAVGAEVIEEQSDAGEED